LAIFFSVSPDKSLAGSDLSVFLNPIANKMAQKLNIKNHNIIITITQKNQIKL